MNATPVVLLASVLALPPAAVCAERASRPESATVEATAHVESVLLPPKKAGRRDAKYALGKDSDRLALDLASEGLRSLNAFRQVVTAGGEYALDLRMLEGHHEVMDLSLLQSRQSRVDVRIEAETRWIRAHEVIHSGPVVASARVEVGGRPGRRTFEEAWREAIRLLAREAFADAYRAGAFGNPPDAEWVILPAER